MALANRNDIDRALQQDNRDELFRILDLDSADFRPNSQTLLDGLGDRKVIAIDAVELANDLFGRIINPARAIQWRSFITPRLLQLRGGDEIVDTTVSRDLTKFAAAESLESAPLEQKYATCAGYLNGWLDRHVSFAVTSNTLLEHLDDDDRLVLVPPPGGTQPPIFHPLVLSNLRPLLKKPEYRPIARPLCQWLVDNIFRIVPRPEPTVETAFAAGAVILDVAGDDDPSWPDLVNKVIDFVAAKSKGEDAAQPAWQGKQAQVKELLDGCTFWHQPQWADQLRAKAITPLITHIDRINSRWEDLESTLKSEWFSPGFESAASTPLPDRRGNAPSFQDENLNKDAFAMLLADLKKRGANVAANTTALEAKVKEILPENDPAAAFAREFINPIAQAALLAEATAQPDGRLRLTREFLQERLAELPVSSGVYETGQAGPLLTRSLAWSKAVNAAVAPAPAADAAVAPAPAAPAAAVLKAWGVLELWDQSRGRFSDGSDEAATLLNVDTLAWLKDGGPPLPDLTLEDLRRDLAAAAHMVFLPQDAAGTNFQTKILGRVDDAELEGQQTTLRAAYIEMGLTRLAGGVGPSTAFPEIETPDGVQKLIDWAIEALQSGNAWEMRAGMNAFIFLTGLADAMDYFIIARALGGALARPSMAGDLIDLALADLAQPALAPAPAPSDGRSMLPLALVAADLLRYTRTVARGITLPGLETRPSWLPAGADPIVWLADLEKKLVAAPRRRLQLQAAGSGLPFRLLLLALLQIRLDRYARDRRLTVKPPREEDVRPLSALRRAVREVFSGDELLRRKQPISDVPWWQARYWAGIASSSLTDRTLGADGKPDLNFTVPDDAQPEHLVANWFQSARSDPLGHALMNAAILESAVPPMPPPPQTGGDDATVLVYRASYSADVDGRLEGEFPMFSWKASREFLTMEVAGLEEAEEKYTKALDDKIRTEEMIKWLKAPLRMSTADFKQQIDAAIAEVRQAEAELEGAEHESVAAILEQAAAGFVQEAAKLEIQRQAVLNKIADKDEEIAAKRSEIAAKERDGAHNEKAIAGLKAEQAGLYLEKANLAKAHIVDEIKAIKQVLGNPAGEPPLTLEVLLPDGKPLKVKVGNTEEVVKANGQLAVMAFRIEHTFRPKLAQALADAHAELAAAEAEDRKAKRKANRYKMIAQVCKAIGAVVGAFFSNPMLGAEIGAAVAELGIGIAENKPAEDILLGLSDNAFSIAGAAGVDLEAKLNELSTKGLAEVSSFLDEAGKSLGPVLDSLPKIFDEPMVGKALSAFGLDEGPEIAGLAKTIFAGLPNTVNDLSGAINAGGGLGTILKGAKNFDSADDFAKNLQKKILDSDLLKDDLAKFNDLKAKSGELGRDFEQLLKEDDLANFNRLKALSGTLGQDVEQLMTTGREMAAGRLTTLAVNNLSEQAMDFRSDTLKKWIDNVQGIPPLDIPPLDIPPLDIPPLERRFWNSPGVQEEARMLVENLFPHAESRSAVLASLSSALLNPETKRGQIQGFLKGIDVPGAQTGGWLGELDKTISEVMGNPLAGGGTRKEQASAQVEHFKKANADFETKLIPFLKGGGEERAKLLKKLSELEDELVNATIDINALKIDNQIAEINVETAQDLLDAAEAKVEEMELGEVRATLMRRVVDLSGQQAGLTADEKQKLAEASKARAEAAAARITAARMKLAANRAQLQGALRRGAEAGRIRAALDRPGIDVPAAVAADARRAHADHLERALLAYRELLRFYASIGAAEVGLDARPDLNPAGGTWSGALKNWLTDTDAAFSVKTGTITAKVLPALTLSGVNLTPRQIRALAGRDGLRLIFCKKGEPEDGETELFRVPNRLEFAPTPGLLLAGPWRAEFERHRFPLDPDAAFVDETTIFAGQVPVETFEWSYDNNGVPQGPKTTAAFDWVLPGRQRIRVRRSPDGSELIVSRDIKSHEVVDDAIIDQISVGEIDNARIVGIFLAIGQKDDNDVIFLGPSDYKLHAEHRGDVRSSSKEIRLGVGRNSWSSLPALGTKLPPGRLFIIEDEDDPIEELLKGTELAKDEGDPDLLTLQGLRLSGTTVIRLEAAGSKKFHRVKIKVLYKTYAIS